MSLRIWDNAAFDPSLGPTYAASGTAAVLNPLQPVVLDLSKENQNPNALDAEIAAIESEIARLSKNLAALLLKRSQLADRIRLKSRDPKFVPSKFLNHHQTPPPSKPALQPKPSTCPRPHRRGLSLGPADLLPLPAKPTPSKNQDRAFQRGMSIGPSEILRAANSKVSDQRRGAATVGPKVSVERKSEAIKPKNLFSTEEEETAVKKRPKGRVVASRYSLPSGSKGGGDEGGSKRRKWSPPSPPTVGKIGEGLSRIRVLRGVGVDSPRDSGRAKKVAELVGKRSYFSEGSILCSSSSSSSPSCQRLSFEE